MNDMALKNDDRLNIRLPGELLETLADIQAKHGLNATEIARRCLEQVAAFYREHGFFTFPVKIEPEAGFLERAMQYKTDSAIAGAKREAEAKEKPRRKTG